MHTGSEEYVCLCLARMRSPQFVRTEGSEHIMLRMLTMLTRHEESSKRYSQQQAAFVCKNKDALPHPYNHNLTVAGFVERM